MMSYRHGVQYDIAFTNVYREGMTFDDVIVGWGERGRIGEAAIKPRIKLVLAGIAPWIDPSAVDSLPAPIMMRAGASWNANLVLGPNGPAAAPSSLRMGVAANAARNVRDDIKRRDKVAQRRRRLSRRRRRCRAGRTGARWSRSGR